MTLQNILDAPTGQLSLDELLDEFRAAIPPAPVPAVEIGIRSGLEDVPPDMIRTRSGLEGDVSPVEIGTEPHDGACPYEHHCETRKRAVTYRPGHPCHWVAFDGWNGKWKRCPTYQNNGGAAK